MPLKEVTEALSRESPAEFNQTPAVASKSCISTQVSPC
jgi:hypothetical protein